MVEIYLSVTDSPFPFLSIPLSAIERLSIRPFKWLRYVMYSICGARGDLYTTLDGPPVNYNSTSLADDNVIYYKPSGDCIFVDHKCLNDRITSTASNFSRRRTDFRRRIVDRDGSCIITREPAEDCDAAHLIPRSKPDEYIQRVVNDRWPLYDGTPPSIPPSIRINDTENGVLLRKDLHSKLGKGRVAFLKTPNYLLDPTDIPRVELPDLPREGPARTDHYTLQRLVTPQLYDPSARSSAPVVAFAAGLDVDALFHRTDSLPPAVILDYVYGMAAYRCWNNLRDSGVHGVMENYRGEHYIDIPAIPPGPPDDNDNDYDNANNSPPSDDSDRDSSYDPNAPACSHDPDHPSPTSQRRQRTSARTGDVMAKTMDELNRVLMFVQGITPQEAARRREKQTEEEELKAQEASRSKVAEWMKSMDVASLS